MRLLITGGAGFIGTNTVEGFLQSAEKITVLDNFYRPTSRKNATYLTKLSPKISLIEGSVLDQKLINQLVSQADAVIHLAAQVAVTTSLTNPQIDFDINVKGSFMVLEAVRQFRPEIPVIYSSTNKVYGDLVGQKIDRRHGVAETVPIDLYSPYGCSKGSADLYFLDYARSFGLKTVVLRQSCIYGEHQFGIEDQGWLAFFVLQHLRRQPITIYGTGKQVRDLLQVKDLVQLYRLVIQKIDQVAGQVFNVGGGVANSTSINQALAEIQTLVGWKTPLTSAAKRLGDQDYFVADIRQAKRLLGWQPTINYQPGLTQLVDWCRSAV
ncbi:MAG TPA: CDP-paratose 2-epimerase [Candidatus Pacebacteria bacterium]|nr:CDP-paratose 2-epimerase [Candidatus Paceibacterota bacterium]